MHCKISRRAFGLVFAALMVVASGCGQRQFDVTGKVTYNGVPLNKPDGQISFIGPTGALVAASIEADGTYRAPNVPAGMNRVAVGYLNPKAKKDKATGKLKPGETPPPGVSPFLTPEKYGVADNSGLSVTVDKETVFDVNLTGPPIR